MSQIYQKIAFQGEKAAYSDLACRHAFPALETVPCSSFRDAFIAVREGRADLAMIPVDNTIAGRVADVHYLMPRENLHIIAEHFEPIEHCLLAPKGATLETIKTVHSHVHALPQCRNIIQKYGWSTHVSADTASAAMYVAAQDSTENAAISSVLAADIYNLAVLQKGIQDENHNTTRFLVLAAEPETPPYDENVSVITSLVFEVRNIPAALYKSLGGFATNGISLAKLESYVDEGFQAAKFYCDVEAHSESPAFKLAIEELKFFARNIRLLGTYPAHDFRAQKR